MKLKLFLNLLKLSRYLHLSLPFSTKVRLHNDIIVIEVNSRDLDFLLIFLKKHSYLRLNNLLDIWGVDHPNNLKRFEVNYLLCSVLYNIRVVVRVFVEDNVSIPSVAVVFPSANWLEREVWDMFGILFYGNSDLRRILTDYGFEGHPLRKDFPLSGYLEVRYDDSEKRVLQEPLEVSQEYRAFNFKSPWEN